MEYIQLDKSDYKKLMENLFVLPSMYSSGNRRVNICKLRRSYFRINIALETIQKDIKYFKKLQAEILEGIFNEKVECLAEVISVLEKYNK